jgi:hypothetical protein
MNPMLWAVACGIGACVIAVLVAVYRRAAAHRELELAERLLEEDEREQR